MRPLIAAIVLTLCSSPAQAPAQTIPDHSGFTAILADYVDGALVNYAGLREDHVRLALYLERLGRTSPTTLDLADRDTRLAFWINAYNACALKLVIDYYPIERRGGVAGVVNRVAGLPANSIRQIPDTWDRAFCRVAQTERSLDGIEHGIIRPLGDPRIHFAVNCASRSCPDLAPHAYTADSLQAQLDAAVRRFMADADRHYRLERNGDAVLHLNKVLDWYKDDFNGTEGVLDLLARYVPEADATLLRSGRVRVEYFEYDWTLNDTAVFGQAQP